MHTKYRGAWREQQCAGEAPVVAAADLALIESAQEGDEDAWAVLFDRHYPRLYRFFRARMGSPEQAEELAANVFLEAFKSIHAFRWVGRPFEAWLFGIARHQLAAFYGARGTHQDVAYEVESEPAARDEFVAVEIRDILAALPTEYRAALELRYIVGLSGVEAAAVLGRSHGAFRSLLFRAARAFREEYRRSLGLDPETLEEEPEPGTVQEAEWSREDAAAIVCRAASRPVRRSPAAV